ncbi:MAG: DNA polymerase I [Planctomycetota bacterium]|nr:DNA polymerase I [Planctomycetota bacterium]
MPTLYIIDAYAQFFRHYHAIRTPMTSPVTREPTNLTFGFVGLLLKLLRGDGPVLQSTGGTPTYLAVALDVSGDTGTFRSTLYPDYKAHRPPPPEDLRPQAERCLSLLREIGVPILGAEGFEADDVIATLVRTLSRSHPDLAIRIVSKDKDLKQLLDEPANPAEPASARVQLADLHTETTFSAATLRAEMGLSPAQVIDLLALMGDSADNVPGVPGVGEKTAAAMLQEFGTLDAIIARASEIKGKRGENVRASIPLLDLSRKLVTLRDDTPISLDLEAARVDRLHVEKLLPILKDLGFNRYQNEVRSLLKLPSEAPAPASSPTSSAATAAPASTSASTPKPARKSQTDDGFGSLFSQVPDAPVSAAPPSTAAPSQPFELITTADQLAALARDLSRAPLVAIDVESTSLSPHSALLCGISYAFHHQSTLRAGYVPIRSPEPATHLDEQAVLAALRPFLEDPARAKCGHNLKYDLLVLRNAGIILRGLDHAGSCDTMVASYLLDPSRSSHSLDSLALALLGRGKQSIAELIGTGAHQRTFDTVPVAQAAPYAADDARLALELALKVTPLLEESKLTDLFTRLEMPLVAVLAELEWNGILVDPAELDRQRDRLLAQVRELIAKIDAEADRAAGRRFDPDSPKQLGEILFNAPTDPAPGLGLRVIKRLKTGPSTDAEVLEKLTENPEVTTPLPQLILDYRQLTKLISTYLVALKDAIHPRTHRVHASFHQTVAATGRLSSSDPNLQNIPIRTEVGREIRRAFVAPPGRLLVTADYSQIELRLLAHLSRDEALIRAFHEDQDIHAAVAAQINNVPLASVTREQRSAAKMVNFGIVYGITPFGLARRLNIGNSEAAVIIDQYKRRFPGISTFLAECIHHAREHGFVETILGRRRPIPDIDSSTPARRALAERTAINSVVQGSAADLIKLAMIDLHRLLSPARNLLGAPPAIPNVLMLLQIHDELVLECDQADAPRVRDLVTDRMIHALDQRTPLLVPLKADAHIARDWFEGK